MGSYRNMDEIKEDKNYRTVKISKPRYIKDKNHPNFLRVFIDYPTPAGAVIALGKETMSGQIRRLGAAVAMQNMDKVAKDLKSKYNIEDIEITDMENGKIQLFAVSDDFEGKEVKYLDEALDFEDVMYLRDDKKDLEDRIAQLYRDMEQEAEPEGGDIANRYANELDRLEDKLYKIDRQINDYDMNEGTDNEKEIKGQEMVDYIMKTWDWSEEKTLKFLADKFGNSQEIKEGHSLDSKDMQVLKDAFNHLFTGSSIKFTKLEDLRRVIKYIMDTNAKELNEKLEQVNEKLCKKGEAYRKRRMAAGEKSSAYLSGRAVKVCKGQMSGKKKKK